MRLEGTRMNSRSLNDLLVLRFWCIQFLHNWAVQAEMLVTFQRLLINHRTSDCSSHCTGFNHKRQFLHNSIFHVQSYFCHLNDAFVNWEVSTRLEEVTQWEIVLICRKLDLHYLINLYLIPSRHSLLYSVRVNDSRVISATSHATLNSNSNAVLSLVQQQLGVFITTRFTKLCL